MSYEENYPATAVGQIEIKKLPASKVMQTARSCNYTWEANGSFRILFKELQANKLAMTVPVEADRENNSMRFYVAKEEKERISKATQAEAEIKSLPERTVLSIGLRGGYSEAQYKKGCGKLSQWFTENPHWQKNGEPYAVYWNGPFTLPFLKRAEIHQPVINRAIS